MNYMNKRSQEKFFTVNVSNFPQKSNFKIQKSMKSIVQKGKTMRKLPQSKVIENLSDLKRIVSNKNLVKNFQRKDDGLIISKIKDLLKNQRIYESFQEDYSEYSEYSLFIFSQENLFRKKLIGIVNSLIFKIIIHLIILFYSIYFSIYGSLYDPKTLNNLLHVIIIRKLMIVLYILEMLIKIVAYGFYQGNKSYIKNYWNSFDFICTIVSIVGIYFNFDFTLLRIYRLIEILKYLGILEEIKILIQYLFDNSKYLIKMIYFSFFMISIFSIISLTNFKDLTNYRCRMSETPTLGNWEISKINRDVCGGYNKCKRSFEINEICGNYELINEMGLFFQNPLLNLHEETHVEFLNYGITNFQNFFSSFITFYIMTTREGWTQITYNLQNSYNYYLAFIFMSISVLVLNYLIVNFTVGIIMNNFRAFIEHEELEKNRENYILKKEKVRLMIRNVEMYENYQSKIFKLKKILSSIKNFKIFKKIPRSPKLQKKKTATFFFM